MTVVLSTPGTLSEAHDAQNAALRAVTYETDPEAGLHDHPVPAAHSARIRDVPTRDEVGTLIRAYFPEQPEVMIAIAECESELQQLRPDGTPLISPTADAGALQVNLTVHQATAERLGLDVVNSLEDNLHYARMLYSERGLSPWACARKLGFI